MERRCERVSVCVYLVDPRIKRVHVRAYLVICQISFRHRAAHFGDYSCGHFSKALSHFGDFI